MTKSKTAVRTYALRLYPNPGKAKEAFGILLEQRGWLYEFVRQHMATGEEAWTVSTKGLGEAAHNALHRAKGIIKAGRNSSIATGNQFNEPRCLPLIGDGTVEPAEGTTFDYWIKMHPGPRMPAKSHKALNGALKRGGTLANTAEIAVDRKGRLIARVFVKFDIPEAVDTGDYLGVDVGVNAGVARSDGYIGKSLRPILGRTRAKNAERQRQGHLHKLQSRQSACKQFLNREAKRIVTLAVSGRKSIAIESSKALANLRMTGSIGQWARQHLGQRVHCLAEVSSAAVREVWAAYSSIECRACGCRDKRNRSGVVFRCVQCATIGHADTLASRTLRDRGRAAFLRERNKGTKNSDRLQIVPLSGGDS